MLYLISNCTNGKKILPNQINLLRCYSNNGIDNVSFSWKKNLEDNQFEKRKARNIYKGVSWKAITDVEKEFNKRFDTTLLIASAGYGLINANKLIVSYGITFSKNAVDSVSKHFENQDWWDKINHYDLNEFKNASAIFICVSKDYLNAMSNYIEKLIQAYGTKVFIIGISKEYPEKIKANILYFDKRFNEYEAGTLLSLGQRCMRWLSKEITKNNLILTHSTLQEYIDEFLNGFQFSVVKTGEKASDEKVESIIEKYIKTQGDIAAFKALKNFRENGYSCEQKRFHRIFNKIKKKLNDNQ